MAKERSVEFTIKAKDAASAAMKQVQKTAGETVEKLFGFKEILKGITGLAGAFSLATIIKDLVDLGVASDRTFRQIAANLPTATDGIARLKAELEDIAKVSGRSREELQKAAVEFSRLGVGSADDIHRRVRASVELADATGESLDTTIAGLDEVMHLFGLSASDAEQQLANLASAAKGRVDLRSLFDAFRTGAKYVHDLGLDADTATKAMVALLDKGLGTRAIREEFTKKTADDLKELASQAHISGDALEDLRRRAKLVEDGADRAGQRVKNDLSRNLEELGTVVLPPLLELLNRFVGRLNDLIDAVKRQDLGSFFGIPSARQMWESVNNPAGLGPFDHGNHGSSGTWGDGTNGAHLLPGMKTTAPAVTPEELRAIDAAKKKLEDLRDEFNRLASTTADAKPKSVQFAEAIADITKKATAAHMPAAELQKRIAELQQTMGMLKDAEAQQAIDDLAAAFAELSTGALAQLDRQLDAQVKKLEKEGASADDIAKLKAQYNALAVAIADATATSTGLAETQRLVGDSPVFTADKATEYDRWAAAAANVKDKIAGAMNPREAETYKQELEQIEGVLAQLSGHLFELPPAEEKSHDAAKKLADAWVTVGRSIIAASQALGAMDEKTASMLQNLASLGEGIANIFAGNKAAGAAQSATSLAAIISGLIRRGPTNLEIQSDASTIAGLFAGLRQQIHGSGSLDAQIENAKQQYDQARVQVESTLSGKRDEKEREERLRQLNELEAERIRQLREEYAEQQKRDQENDQVRILRATGHAEEADAMAFALEQQREYADAVKAGADAAALASMATRQAAEAQDYATKAAQRAAEAAVQSAQTYASQYAQIHDTTDPTALFAGKAQGYKKAGGALGALLGGYDLTKLTPEDIAALDKSIADLFDKLHESPESVDLAGLSIDDLIAALLDLDGAADSVADSVKAAADSTRQALDHLDLTEAIFGADPSKHAAGVAAAYDLDLSGFKLTTKEGRDAAIAYLRSLYGDHPELGDAIAATITALNAIPFPADDGAAAATPASDSAATAGYKNLTTVQGDILTDQGRRSLTYLAVLPEIKDLLGRMTVQTPSFSQLNVAPAFASYIAQQGAGGPGSVTIENLTVAVQAGANPTETGQQVGEAIVRSLDIEFGRKVRVQQRYTGSIRTTST